ncbi:hypothetical protein [Bacteroides fragilis]|uniref:hypothetical protein n=1 Tax=Bacteroides fragilis TaxID=817 RepID=UPI0022AA4674|nr:hypothetical protein [Bacteroides fragilis]MCZ2505100.1 hypothetical protein [Bacteroides fragilis]
MKNLLLLALALLIFSCNDIGMQKVKARKQAEESGLRVDSIILGIRFNDSPEQVQAILSEWASHNPLGQFEFHFTYPQRLNQYKWVKSKYQCCFYNDSLYRFSLSAEVPSYKWKECFEDLDSLYSYKYGSPVRNPGEQELDWYKGNLNIHIDTYKSKYASDKIYVSYINEDFYSRKGVNYKSFDPDENRYGVSLEYSEDYWNKTYQKGNDILLDNATEEI